MATGAQAVKDQYDQILLDAFPDTTRELAEWERHYALEANTDEATRRLALAAEFRATGGQSVQYIEGVLQSAGFPVYVHEWFEPGGPPYVARDPRDYTTQPLRGTVQDRAVSTAPQCRTLDANPYRCNALLANKIGYFVNRDLTQEAPPPVPEDPAYWPYFLYFGDETFPDVALLPPERKREFERLVGKLSPAQHWKVLRVWFGLAEEVANTAPLAWWRVGYGMICNNPVLTAPEDFADASWTKANLSVTSAAVAGPDTGTTADTLTAVAGGAATAQSIPANQDSNVPQWVVATVAPGTSSWCYLSWETDANTRVWFDISNGVVGTVGSSVLRAQVTPLDGGYYEIAIKVPGSAGDRARIAVAAGDASTTAGAGDSIHVHKIEAPNWKIASWAALGTGGYVLTQATAALQPTMDPYGLNGAPAVYFDRLLGQKLVCSVAADTWNFLHDGTGASVFTWWQADDTGTSASTLFTTQFLGSGILVGHDQDNELLQAIVDDGAGAPAIQVSSPPTTFPAPGLYRCEMRWQQGRTPKEYTFDYGAGVFSGDGIDWTTGNNATSDLYIGGSQFASSLGGFMGDFVLYRQAVSDAARNVLRAYGQDLYVD